MPEGSQQSSLSTGTLIRRGNERVPADVAMMVSLDDISAKMTMLVETMDKLLRLTQSSITTGFFSFTVPVTDVLQEITLNTYWMGFALDNAGPGAIRMRINTMEGDVSRELSIASGDGWWWDARFPVIRKLFLVANAGTTATVKLSGSEGKWR
jgi:hypothetical protein